MKLKAHTKRRVPVGLARDFDRGYDPKRDTFATLIFKCNERVVDSHLHTLSALPWVKRAGSQGKFLAVMIFPRNAPEGYRDGTDVKKMTELVSKALNGSL